MNVLRDRIAVACISLAVLLIVSLPVWLADRAGPPTHVFGGFLFNPIDGNTYLAKMQQGYAGSWQFRLPYTAEAVKSAYLFVFYLGLGHLSRLFSASMIWTFHLSRFVTTALMLSALFRFYRRTLPSAKTAWLAFLLAALGSGLGWLSVPFGGFTADFWVAEAYPFLSAYANPHFPLSLALMLVILTPAKALIRFRLEHLFLSVALALISPFGIAMLIGIFALLWLFQVLRSRSVSFPDLRLLWLVIGGGSILLYDTWAIQADPLLAGWNAQNVTPSPEAADVLISFSPALPFAAIGLFREIRDQAAENQRNLQLSTWLLAVLIMVILPINLQRRLLIGLYIPVAGLAATGLEAITQRRPEIFRLLGLLVLLISLPTNLLVLLAARHGITTRDPALFLTSGEKAALDWIAEETALDALVLAAPDTGLLIPAHTGRRVIYGHPFETVNAYIEKAAVSSYFEGVWEAGTARSFFSERGVDYVFWGPRERALGPKPELLSLESVVEFAEVTIFRVGGDDDR